MLWYECNTLVKNAASLHLNHCNQFSHYCCSPPKEEETSEDSQFAHLGACLCGTTTGLSSKDENTRE